jgi:hypothetical protein
MGRCSGVSGELDDGGVCVLRRVGCVYVEGSGRHELDEAVEDMTLYYLEDICRQFCVSMTKLSLPEE